MSATEIEVGTETEIHIWLEIENVYEDGEVVITYRDAKVTPPPALDKDYDDEQSEWELDYIFPHTGTGKEEGDSAYFVKVNKSTHPDLIPVDTTFEFGL